MVSRGWRLVLILLFTYPFVSFAQTQGLVPCGFSTGNGANYYTSSTSCDLCSFGQLIQNIINYMVGISIPLAALLFAWAGILYFTSAGSPARVMRARKIFTSVFIGFLFVISAWLVVQTLLSTLVKGTVWFGGSWNSLQCTDPENRPRDKSISEWLGGIFSGGGTSGGQTNPGVTPTPTPGLSGGMSEADARATLAAAGVQVNAAPCASGVSTGCTTLAGESANNINQIVNLSNSCRQMNSTCQVVISGGAEPHGATNDPHAGGSAIDVRSNPALDQYIRSLAPAKSFTPTAFKDMAGNVYTLEGVGGPTGSTGAHWHVDLYQRKQI
jgi:hypothetical protein